MTQRHPCRSSIRTPPAMPWAARPECSADRRPWTSDTCLLLLLRRIGGGRLPNGLTAGVDGAIHFVGRIRIDVAEDRADSGVRAHGDDGLPEIVSADGHQ